MATVLSTERLERLRALARTLIEDYGLKGRWRWEGQVGGHRPSVHLATREHGRRYVMGFERAGMSGGQPSFPARAGDSAWSYMRRAAEISVFEVCPDATSKDDPRIYRTHVVGFRSPAAEWLAEMDPETVLALVDTADVLWGEVVAQEHESLRWEHPLQPPEWTQRIRERLNRPWTPDHCTQCAEAPARYLRDRFEWPHLYGWSPETAEVAW